MSEYLILLVEDNPDDEALTIRSLQKAEIPADRVLVAHDGVEALEYLFGSGNFAKRDLTIMPRFVLLDLKLPRVDGLELLRRLRADERTRSLPAIVFTSSNERQDIINCYALGANSYIRKPVDFLEFSETVRQLGQYWLGVNLPAPMTATVS